MQNHKEFTISEFQRWLAGFIGERLSSKELEIVVSVAVNIFLTNELMLYHTPRRVVRSNDGDSLRCPNCGTDLMGGPCEDSCSFEPGSSDLNNCWECGQKLDWEVE